MIESMTGFGSATYSDDKYQIKIELRTLNSKFLDLSYKIPKEFSDRELEIKNFLTTKLKRGKINVSIDFTILNRSSVSHEINKELFLQYFEQFRSLAKQVEANDDEIFRLALQSPDVIQVKEEEEEAPDWGIFHNVFEEAVNKCVDFRKQEGEALSNKLTEYINSIGEGLEKVIERDPERVRNIKSRIENNLEEFVGTDKVDQNRFEQELIYYIERLDITEEKDRLGNHLKYFIEILNGPDSNGKKLGFISQEIGREINTIGSKSNDATLQRFVVEMKEELEKIKEQVLNII